MDFPRPASIDGTAEDEPGTALVRPRDDLDRLPEILPAITSLAEKIVPSGVLPAHIKTVGQALAIILAGRELGMPPMRALRSLAMVQGKIIEAADSQLERFKAKGGKAEFSELTDAMAVLCLTHPNGDQHVERFSMDDARRAGLAGGVNWQKYPRSMLRSRTISNGLRSVGFGVGTYDQDEAAEIAPNGGAERPRRGSLAHRAKTTVLEDGTKIIDKGDRVITQAPHEAAYVEPESGRKTGFVFPLGKAKDRDIADADLGYLEWAWEAADRDPDFKRKLGGELFFAALGVEITYRKEKARADEARHIENDTTPFDDVIDEIFADGEPAGGQP